MEGNNIFPFVWEEEDIAVSPRTGVSTVQFTLFADEENQVLRVNEEGTVNMEALSNAFTEVINRAVTVLHPVPGDRLGLTIEGVDSDGNDVTVGIPFRPFSELTDVVVLNAIELKLNSSTSLIADFRLTFSLLHREEEYEVKIDLRGQPRHTIFKGNLSNFVKDSRSIIQIHPTGDPYADHEDCFFQFLALGICHLVSMGSIDGITDLEIDLDTYQSLKSGTSRFRVRHELGARIKNYLESHGIISQSHQDLQLIEELFDIRIVLYSIVLQLNISYPPEDLLPYDIAKPTIFGLVQDIKDEEYQHVHFISNPTKLSLFNLSKSGSQHVCMLCFQAYIRRRHCINPDCESRTLMDRCTTCHICDKACKTCCTVECGRFSPGESITCVPYDDHVVCGVCKKDFFSQRCEILHEDNCSAVNKRICDICGKGLHRGRNCDEFYCYMCGVKLKKNDAIHHQCYLKREKLKEPTTSYWVYDFESCLDENNKHVLYLCTACPVYDDAYDMEELQAKYEWRLVNGKIVFIFWGLGNEEDGTGVYRFFDFLLEPQLMSTAFFAHNAGKYDVIFIEYYLGKYKNLIGSKIQRGLKIMYLNFPQLKICFKDSLNFIPTALRNMSTDFKIDELKKGFFPHSLMSTKFLTDAASSNFIVERPPSSAFNHDFHASAKPSDLAELQEFQLKWDQDNSMWNLKEDAITYCISDTVLLAMTIKVFKEQTELMTDEIQRDDEVEKVNLDPFQYLTLPSAVMKFYLSQVLREQTIAIIDRYPITVKLEQAAWLSWIETSQNISITRSDVYQGLNISGYTFQDNNVTLYRFISCYDNGCPKCFSGSRRNHRRNMSFASCLYQFRKSSHDTLHNMENLMFINIIDCWSHEWEHLCDFDSDVRTWKRLYDLRGDMDAPLDPREAYKGGHTEMYKMRYNGDISMVDFVSQYPTSMIGSSYSPYTGLKVNWEMPIGHPTILHDVSVDNFNIDNFEVGVIKCRIVPPDNLYAPFLGCKVPSQIQSGSYEVLYGLCRTCMMFRINRSCTHNDDQRALLGVWTLAEIKYALSIGYRLIEISEIWIYHNHSHELFSNFITPFMIKKILCKTGGLVENHQFTELGNSIKAYVQDLSGRVLSPDDFEDSPAKRTIAKLMMNSFYGKWGQRSIWDESAAFTEENSKACRKLLLNNNMIIKFAEVINTRHGQIVVVDYEQRQAYGRGDSQKNDHIAAHVTAYGRIMLNQVVQAVGEKAIYTDTDSVFHVFMEELPYREGFRTGDLELELRRGHNWSCCGRKFYAYQKGDKVICKQKGVTLKKSMIPLFTPEALEKLILETYDALHAMDGETELQQLKSLKKHKAEVVPQITVNQTLFQTVRVNKLIAEKVTVNRKKASTFLIWALKRRPVFDNSSPTIDTLPYGWK